MERDGVFVGGGGADRAEAQRLILRYANRHGLVAGATGTGKTVTLQVLAQGFSEAGVPVVLADVKGDLAGLAKAGTPGHKLHDAFAERAATIGLDLEYRACPVVFWDVWGEQGHPVRTTVAEMGPLLLSRLMDLTDAQEGVLNVAFRVADEDGLALLDLKDLQALLTWVGANRKDLSLRYGNVSTASVGAIQRSLLVLEGQGGDRLFGEPALDLSDMMAVDADGRGRVNVLAADRLMGSPRLYATLLLWLLSELFETLPEVGDPDRPKLVFFFDEAHLLFDGAPRALLDKVEQVARLIRSKGVGVYFVTQNPDDVPEDILGQLGNRVQHALRAFTARDRRALRQAAETYRENPRFDIEAAIREVGRRRGGHVAAGGQGRARHGRADPGPAPGVLAGPDHAVGARAGRRRLARRRKVRGGRRPRERVRDVDRPRRGGGNRGRARGGGGGRGRGARARAPHRAALFGVARGPVVVAQAGAARGQRGHRLRQVDGAVAGQPGRQGAGPGGPGRAVPWAVKGRATCPRRPDPHIWSCPTPNQGARPCSPPAFRKWPSPPSRSS